MTRTLVSILARTLTLIPPHPDPSYIISSPPPHYYHTRAPIASPTGLRYAWESYPNCGLYSGVDGGPVAGGNSVYGGIAPGCNRKPMPGETWTGVPPDCVYKGSALPVTPFQIDL